MLDVSEQEQILKSLAEKLISLAKMNQYERYKALHGDFYLSGKASEALVNLVNDRCYSDKHIIDIMKRFSVDMDLKVDFQKDGYDALARVLIGRGSILAKYLLKLTRPNRADGVIIQKRDVELLLRLATKEEFECEIAFDNIRLFESDTDFWNNLIPLDLKTHTLPLLNLVFEQGKEISFYPIQYMLELQPEIRETLIGACKAHMNESIDFAYYDGDLPTMFYRMIGIYVINRNR